MTAGSAERITFFGDISGANPDFLATFVRTTADNLYGGAFPNRENFVSDEEVITKVEKKLIQSGIQNPEPINLCDSMTEKTEKIMQTIYRGLNPNGLGKYWIIEDNPILFQKALLARFEDRDSLQTEILNRVTVIKLGRGATFDHTDNRTGLRIASLWPIYGSYPVHSTPNIPASNLWL